jgi:hypothetical protein
VCPTTLCTYGGYPLCPPNSLNPSALSQTFAGFMSCAIVDNGSHLRTSGTARFAHARPKRRDSPPAFKPVAKAAWHIGAQDRSTIRPELLRETWFSRNWPAKLRVAARANRRSCLECPGANCRSPPTCPNRARPPGFSTAQQHHIKWRHALQSAPNTLTRPPVDPFLFARPSATCCCAPGPSGVASSS